MRQRFPRIPRLLEYLIGVEMVAAEFDRGLSQVHAVESAVDEPQRLPDIPSFGSKGGGGCEQVPPQHVGIGAADELEAARDRPVGVVIAFQRHLAAREVAEQARFEQRLVHAACD
ncbi:hypothetical protein QU38_00120, partial [Staphylococcus aureus]